MTHMKREIRRLTCSHIASRIVSTARWLTDGACHASNGRKRLSAALAYVDRAGRSQRHSFPSFMLVLFIICSRHFQPSPNSTTPI